MPQMETSRRSRTGTLTASPCAPRLLHVPYVQVPLYVRPLRVDERGGPCYESQKKQLLHGSPPSHGSQPSAQRSARCLPLALYISSTSDSTSPAASPTAACTGSLNSISMSS